MFFLAQILVKALVVAVLMHFHVMLPGLKILLVLLLVCFCLMFFLVLVMMFLFPLGVSFLVSLSFSSQEGLLQPVHPPVADDPYGSFHYLTDCHSPSHSFLSSFHSKVQHSLTHSDKISRNTRYMWLDNPKAGFLLLE